MKLHDVVQGTPQWLSLRAGLPTASNFDMIVTPKGKVSTQADRYLYTLLAERLTGHAITEAVSTWMDRGQTMEAEAVAYYEGLRELDTTKVGFLTNDAGTIGASPDRLVGDEGLLEIKVPKESTHVSYLLTKAVYRAHYSQVQGQLWISERKWCDILSYHPEMPPALIRVERDSDFLAVLRREVEAFSARLEQAAAEAAAKGWLRPKQDPAWPAGLQ